MSTKVAYDALAAEKAAREAEGFYEPSAEQTAMLKRRDALVARARKIAAEQSAIEKAIETEMRDKGIRALVVNGKNRTLISPVTRTVTYIDEEGLTAAFPEIVAAHRQYEEIVVGFTNKVREPNGDRVTYN